MTHEEKQFCEQCAAYSQCGFVSRKLEYKCPDLDKFSAGMQAGIAKASLWLETEWEDLGIKWVRGAQAAEIIGQFEKAMEL